MNTEREIPEAFADFNRGSSGTLGVAGVDSKEGEEIAP